MNNELLKRFYDLVYKYKEGHLGSCLTALPIIYNIYKDKKPDDIFILSSGHAAIAWYLVLEYFNVTKSADILYEKHGVHPNLDIDNGISCSAGSLGHGLGISIGIALAQPNIRVHCLISDGEAAEGSIYESLNMIRDYNIPNITVHVNANGFAGYKTVDTHRLENILYTILDNKHKQLIFYHTNPILDVPYLHGFQAHYSRLTEQDYQDFQRMYNEKTLCFIS